MKMNQVIAIANGEKGRKEKVISKVYQKLQKPALFQGITRTFKPIDEDSEKYPDEGTIVQLTVQEAIEEGIAVMEEAFNIVATQDCGNQIAKADVKIKDKVIIKDVPATHLIFLEKQLKDIETFVGTFPTLDPAREWEFSDDSSCYKSKPEETHKTKKIPKPIVKYDATPEHPAQTEMFTEDVITGYWTTTYLSGAIKKSEKEEYLNKVRILTNAVKIAREEANGVVVEKKIIGKDVMAFIFGKE